MIDFSILSDGVKQIQVWKPRKKDAGFLLHPKGSRKNSVVRLPKNFIKSQVPGSETKFIAVKKQVSIVFRHVMFCVSQAGTSLRI